MEIHGDSWVVPSSYMYVKTQGFDTIHGDSWPEIHEKFMSLVSVNMAGKSPTLLDSGPLMQPKSASCDQHAHQSSIVTLEHPLEESRKTLNFCF